ncbi:MAG TPA: MarR family EPS-associated transcriptional regulator [Thermoanaerobaculia bacterium]|nr:MarR family EPS-associated transcriptional regulator [Thermoanaerobaculia bacterium]
MVEQRRQLSDELRFRLLELIQRDPTLTQRELAAHLGISLGKVNYCLAAIVKKGLVKARNFKKSHRKMAYAYMLTPHGIEEKARLTLEFLHVKLREVERLRNEIAQLQRDAGVVVIRDSFSAEAVNHD